MTSNCEDEIWLPLSNRIVILRADLHCLTDVPLARPALMMEECESVALLTPEIDSKRLCGSAPTL